MAKAAREFQVFAKPGGAVEAEAPPFQGLGGNDPLSAGAVGVPYPSRRFLAAYRNS